MQPIATKTSHIPWSVCVCACVCGGGCEHSVALLTKIAVYRAVVLSTLLYRCESWVLYRRSVRRLDEFHVRCLRKIAGIKWQDRVLNTEVLCLCGSSGIEAFLLAAQLRWVGQWTCRPHGGRLDSETGLLWTPVVRQTLSVWSYYVLQGYSQDQHEEVRSATPVTEHSSI